MPSMRVVRFFPPGGPEKLEYRNEEKPTDLKKDQVLIRVHAVGHIWPELYWPIYQKPDGSYPPVIPCRDFSGIVAETGPGGVDDPDLQVGSEVLAFTSRRNHEGALAEYAKADVDQVVPKPKSLSFVEAASVPLSALTAWQALFDHGKLQKGQTLLITAVGGATGIWALQFAKRIGARVIGTGTSDRSRQLGQQFGLDVFVNPKTTTLESVVKDVDLVLDCVGGNVTEQTFNLVKRGGLVISIVEYRCEELARQKGVRGLFFIVSMNPEQLKHITNLLDEGAVKTIVDKVYPLEEAQQAYEEGAKQHVHGKLVIQVA